MSSIPTNSRSRAFATPAVVLESLASGFKLRSALAEFLSRAVTTIGSTGVQELLGGEAVFVGPRALVDNIFIVGDAKPGQPIDDSSGGLIR